MMQAELETPYLPKIHYMGEVASTMDAAFEIAREGRLPEWDSIMAKKQTAGRGQMRRSWISPKGNLYASLRLPVALPFTSPAASVAIGALCASALGGLGIDVHLKWPNDIILRTPRGWGKLAGILLEEREGVAIAGIGINIEHAPDIKEMRDDAALPAAALSEVMGKGSLPLPSSLWSAMIRQIYAEYLRVADFSQSWKELAEARLLWRNEEVLLKDGNQVVKGILSGLSGEGAIKIETDTGKKESFSGVLKKA